MQNSMTAKSDSAPMARSRFLKTFGLFPCCDVLLQHSKKPRGQCVRNSIARNSAAITQVPALISRALPVKAFITMQEIRPKAMP